MGEKCIAAQDIQTGQAKGYYSDMLGAAEAGRSGAIMGADPMTQPTNPIGADTGAWIRTYPSEKPTASGEAVEKGEAAMILYWGAVTEEPTPKEKEEGTQPKLVRLGGGGFEGPKFDLFEAPDEKRAHILVARAVGPEYDLERMQTHVRPF